MKIKAVRKNRNWHPTQDHITVGKVYETYDHSDTHAEFYDDKGTRTYALLEDSSHGFDFEVVDEKFKVGDKVRITGNTAGGRHPVGFVGCITEENTRSTMVRVSETKDIEEFGNWYYPSNLESVEEDFGKYTQTCYETADAMELAVTSQTDYMDGEWHDWGGGECPVSEDTLVDIEVLAGDSAWTGTWVKAGDCVWGHDPDFPESDIVRFKVKVDQEARPDPMPIVEPEDSFDESDNVNNPSHYGTGSIECIEYIKDFLTNEEYVGYLRGNVAKYLHRFRYKNGSEDLKKAQWYLKELIENYNGEN